MTTLVSILILTAGPFAAPADAPPLCLDQPGQVALGSEGGIGEQSECNALADCAEYPNVSCQGNTTCTAVDRNCSFNQRGYVNCDGNTTYCGPICEGGGGCTTMLQCKQGCLPCNGFVVCHNVQACDCECIDHA